MEILQWTRSDTTAVLGAIRHICSEGGTTTLLPTHRDLLAGYRDAIFHHPDIDVDDIPPVTPADFASRVAEPEHRRHALEYLTLAPFIRPDIRVPEADLVRAFFAASGARSDALTFMASIARRRILKAQLLVARKLLPRLLPGGPIRHAVRAVHMIRQRRGSRTIAAPYHALERYPANTLGNAFYRFHRNRGFALPGEPGCLPEELSALHDITHILSGYNTDSNGEILAQAFSGGALPTRYSLMIAVTGLLSYHNGLVFDAGGRLALQKGHMRPYAFAEAFARGMGTLSFISGWDFKADWATPVDAIRQRFGITDAIDVWDDPPAEQRVAALAA
ncbi:MAG: hypothetical protein P4L71_00205 [Acetobacteraceae bacterium]|nr:hypothetical protein [Acetobacteraceae bacterium]